MIFIDAPGLTAAEFVNSQSLDQGDFLASVCDRQTLSEGSLQDNTNGYPLGDDLVYLMRTDLAHFVGPVYNAQGQIAGFGSIFLSDCCPGTNVTLSSITVKAVVEQLIAQGSMAGRPMVDAAMEEVQPLHQRYWNLPSGLRFTQVKEGSFAAMAGLETGDILISLGGHPITDWESYYRALWNFCPGQQVDATVYRNQQYITISITVAQSGT